LVKPAQPGFEAALREARLAEAAHLEAVIRAQDAGALRLDHLRSRLLDSLPADSTLRQSLDLRLPPDFPPRLFLDLSRSVAMAADGRSFVLEEDHEDHRSTVATANTVEDMVREVLRLEAHRAIQAARKPESTKLWKLGAFHPLTWAQLLYVWVSGVVVGAALLALVAIFMKKLGF
jgi:hypothetical protein